MATIAGYFLLSKFLECNHALLNGVQSCTESFASAADAKVQDGGVLFCSRDPANSLLDINWCERLAIDSLCEGLA